MSPLPYLPGGESELPAARVLLFADTNHLVQKVDESALTLNGTAFTGIWESGSLSRGGNVEKTLIFLTVIYTAPEATTATIKASGDGGETWAQSRTVTIEASTEGRMRRAQFGFKVTGFDIRLRIELDTSKIFNLYEIHPELIRRGEYVIES